MASASWALTRRISFVKPEPMPRAIQTPTSCSITLDGDLMPNLDLIQPTVSSTHPESKLYSHSVALLMPFQIPRIMFEPT